MTDHECLTCICYVLIEFYIIAWHPPFIIVYFLRFSSPWLPSVVYKFFSVARFLVFFIVKPRCANF